MAASKQDLIEEAERLGIEADWDQLVKREIQALIDATPGGAPSTSETPEATDTPDDSERPEEGHGDTSGGQDDPLREALLDEAEHLGLGRPVSMSLDQLANYIDSEQSRILEVAVPPAPEFDPLASARELATQWGFELPERLGTEQEAFDWLLAETRKAPILTNRNPRRDHDPYAHH